MSESPAPYGAAQAAVLEAADRRLTAITDAYEWSLHDPAHLRLNGTYTAEQLRALADFLTATPLRLPPEAPQTP